jgi:hypothetical protein
MSEADRGSVERLCADGEAAMDRGDYEAAAAECHRESLRIRRLTYQIGRASCRERVFSTV